MTDTTPDPTLQALIDGLIHKLSSAKDSADTERYAAAIEHVTEARKSTNIVESQASALRLERLQSWSAILVPFLSILTLSTTLWMQVQDNAATRASNEANTWRDTVKTLEIDPRNSEGRQFETITLLKSFLGNKSYERDARDLAVFVLPTVESKDTFNDLLAATFGNPTPKDLNDLARISRRLEEDYNSTQAQLTAVENTEAQRKPNEFRPETIGEIRSGVSEKDSLSFALSNLGARINQINAIIDRVLRARSPSAPERVDLSGLYFNGDDLSNISFHNVELDNTTMQGANLSGAVVDETTTDSAGNLGGLGFNRWWLARSISSDDLQYLMQYYYPYWFNVPGPTKQPAANGYNIAPGEVIFRLEYEGNVRRLCKAARLKCQPRDIKFGPVQ